MSIIIFIVILFVLVVAHEFGHFIVAKKNGIRVDQFAFGWGPKLFSFKKGETVYSFNLFPIGGFVKIFGEDPEEESISGPDSKRSFVNKPRYIQAAVLFAGVFFNIVLAWILLSVGFMSGLPTSVGSEPKGTVLSDQALVITSLAKDAPAEKAGLKIGDKIISLETKSAPSDVLSDPTPVTVKSFVEAHGGTPITFHIERLHQKEDIDVIPANGVVEKNTPAIGISMDTVGVLRLSVPKALWEGVKSTGELTYATGAAFINLIGDSFRGHADISSLTGPVGIVGVVGDAAKFGLIYLLSFTALISINLAIINLIPFPALDGGRLLFLLIEKIKGSRINPKIANTLNAVGFFILIALMLIVTYHDIMRLVH